MIHPLCESCGAQCCKTVNIPLKGVGDLDMEWILARGKLNGNVWSIPSRCKYLGDDDRCTIYAVRPRSCKAYEVDGTDCRETRRMAGIPIGGSTSHDKPDTTTGKGQG